MDPMQENINIDSGNIENTDENGSSGNNETPENLSKPKILDIIDFLEMFSIALGIALLVFTFAFRLCTVNGPSMNNTLENGEKLITTNLFYTPKQGDIIVFHQTSDTVARFNEPLVKRVIATEGQKVYIDYAGGKVYVDDVLLEEDYINLTGNEYYIYAEYPLPATVPEGHVFVMGDNRNNSSDSRKAEIGFVDVRRIIGRVVVRITPFSKFGTVK